MLNIQNWESIKADDGSFKRLEAGCYQCVVKNVETRNSRSGKPMLVIAFDIMGGEYDGYFMDLYAKNVENAHQDGKQAKWPNGGVFYQLLDDDHLPRFKAVIEAIEASNPGYKFNMDEKSLKDKVFGGVMREEEYESQRDGSIKTTVRCDRVVPVSKIETTKVPDCKRLKKSAEQKAIDSTEIPF